MRTSTVILIASALALGGCYSSGQQMSADDPRTPTQQNSSGRSSSGQGNDPAPAPADKQAVPGPGSEIGNAGSAPAMAPGTAAPTEQTPSGKTAP